MSTLVRQIHRTVWPTMSRVNALSVKLDILFLARRVICVLKVSQAVVYGILGLGNVLNVGLDLGS